MRDYHPLPIDDDDEDETDNAYFGLRSELTIEQETQLSAAAKAVGLTPAELVKYVLIKAHVVTGEA